MKRNLLVGLGGIIVSFIVVSAVLPIATHAFSLDDAVKQWMTFMRAKVERLEVENAELKTQLASCSNISAEAEAIGQCAEMLTYPTRTGGYVIGGLVVEYERVKGIVDILQGQEYYEDYDSLVKTQILSKLQPLRVCIRGVQRSVDYRDT